MNQYENVLEIKGRGVGQGHTKIFELAEILINLSDRNYADPKLPLPKTAVRSGLGVH